MPHGFRIQLNRPIGNSSRTPFQNRRRLQRSRVGRLSHRQRSHNALGHFLRADLLDHLTPESVAALKEYGIKTAIDLRAEDELSEKPSDLAQSTGIEYFNHNLLGDDELPDVVRDYETAKGMADGYAWILDERQASIHDALSTLSAPGRLPAVFFLRWRDRQDRPHRRPALGSSRGPQRDHRPGLPPERPGPCGPMAQPEPARFCVKRGSGVGQGLGKIGTDRHDAPHPRTP